MRKILVLVGYLLAYHQVYAQPDTLGTRLQHYTYPFPVSYIHTTVQDQPVEIAYMDSKPTRYNGHNVLLMHGKNFPAAYWKHTVQALNNAGYRVIAPDALGFGKSSKPMLQYSFSLLALLTKQLLDTLGIERTAVVGHSMGGMLASRFTLSYPDMVTALVLEDAIGLEDWRSKGVPYRKVDDWFGEEISATYAGMLNYHKTSYYPEWKPEYKEWVDVQYGLLKSSDVNAYVSALTYDMIFNQPVVHEFPDIRVPTLVVVGTEDKTALARGAPEAVTQKLGHYRELGRQAAEQIPGAKLILYNGVGHLPHIEIPAVYHKDLVKFLDAQQ